MIKPAVPGVVGYVIGYGIGFATAIWYAKNRLEAEYSVKLAQEVNQTKEFYKVLHKHEVSPSDYYKEVIDAEPVEIDDDVSSFHRYLEDEGYTEPETIKEAIANIRVSFPEAQEVELKEGEEPESITEDELEQNEFGYEAQTLTFFREDSVLCHEDGQIIYVPSEVIGAMNRDSLDTIADDVKQVFFRNHRTRIDYIVDLDPDGYADTYLKHEMRHNRSRRPKRPKFRVDDE